MKSVFTLVTRSRSGGGPWSSGERNRNRLPVGACGRRVYKLYLPMPAWTLVDAFAGKSAQASGVDPMRGAMSAFLCLKCADLLYESAERTASPGVNPSGARRHVHASDRFIKRISGGVMGRRDVFTDS